MPNRLTTSAARTIFGLEKPGLRIGARLARLISKVVFTIAAPDIELVLARHEVSASASRSDIGGLRAGHRGGGGKGNTSDTDENAFDFHAEKFARKPRIANGFMTKELIRVTH